MCCRPMGTLKMTNKNRGWRRVLKSFVRFDRNGTLETQENPRYDATRFSFLVFTTIAYAVAVLFIIIGVPLRGVTTHPVPREDLPYVIPFFILVYIAIIGLLYLRDRFRNKH